jgi:hypothetical protein
MYRPLAIDKHCQVPIFPAVNARLAAIDKPHHVATGSLTAAWLLLVPETRCRIQHPTIAGYFEPVFDESRPHVPPSPFGVARKHTHRTTSVQPEKALSATLAAADPIHVGPSEGDDTASSTAEAPALAEAEVCSRERTSTALRRHVGPPPSAPPDLVAHNLPEVAFPFGISPVKDPDPVVCRLWSALAGHPLRHQAPPWWRVARAWLAVRPRGGRCGWTSDFAFHDRD